jgi:hypothetical protein
VFRQQRRKISIFSKMKQILLVKCVNLIVGVFFDDRRMNEVRFPFIFDLIKGLEAIKRETSRKTSYGAE